MFRTRTGEITLKVLSFRMLAKALTPLPAAKDEVVDGEVVRHATLADPEVRYRQRYADLAVNPEVRQIFQHPRRRGPRAARVPGRARLPGGGDAHPAAASTAAQRPNRLSPITTSSNRTCTCASRSSCISNGCWWADTSASMRSGAISAMRACPSSTTRSSPSWSSTGLRRLPEGDGADRGDDRSRLRPGVGYAQDTVQRAWRSTSAAPGGAWTCARR